MRTVLASAPRPKIKETPLYRVKVSGHDSICSCQLQSLTINTPYLGGKISVIEKEGRPTKLLGDLLIRIRTNDVNPDLELAKEAIRQGLGLGFRDECRRHPFYEAYARVNMPADDPERERKIA